MIRIILTAAMTILLFQAHAWASEEDSANKYNEVVDHIYSEILELRDRYPELSNFSKNAIKRNTDGFKEIIYEHQAPGDYAWDSQEDPYAFRFSVKVRGIHEETPDLAPQSEWKFPLMGIKVLFEAHKDGQLANFDPHGIIERDVEDLNVFEQNDLPFRLELSADKDVYDVREPITLTITLRNLGSQPFLVVDLNERSLSCKIDDRVWGGKISEEAGEKVLHPLGTLTKVLRVQGITEPKETEVSCFYSVGFKGVRPFSRLKVRIKPAL
jgi:hypothetical protein